MAHSASLKAACRAAYIDNMPLTQIAKAQNVPLATLRSWKRRAAACCRRPTSCPWPCA